MPDVKQEFDEILSQFETAMLVTQAKGGALHARPMAIAGREGEQLKVEDPMQHAKLQLKRGPGARRPICGIGARPRSQ